MVGRKKLEFSTTTTATTIDKNKMTTMPVAVMALCVLT
jgi:hypothetical protein